MSCSKDEIKTKDLVGTWNKSYEKYYVDGKEIKLDAPQLLVVFLKDGSIRYFGYDPNAPTIALPYTFQKDGTFMCFGIMGTYEVYGKTVDIKCNGLEKRLIMEGEYLVDTEEMPIDGYMIEVDGQLIEERSAGTFKHQAYYQK